MNRESQGLVSKMLPEWDDTITRAQYRVDVAPMPAPRRRPEPSPLLEDFDESWHTAAACIGKPGHWWYPPAEGPGSIDGAVLDLELRAKDVCAVCPVRTACLAFALANREEYGIWGGLTPRERGFVRVRAGLPSLRSDGRARQMRRRRRAELGDDTPIPPPEGSAHVAG